MTLVRFAPRHFGNDISKKFNKFGIRIGEATSVPTLSFFKEFFDIFSPFDEKKDGFSSCSRDSRLR